MILAGEASGDAHGARVAAEIRRRWPGAELVGLGGERMAEAGVRLLSGLRDLSVMGFAEVVRRLGFFRRLERRLRRLLKAGGFDIVLPVDYPGLNLRIARYAARLGIPVLYYIGPQVWAWKARRARRLSRIAKGVALILPFEPELYLAHGGRAVFVGHPLLDESPSGDPVGLAEELGLDRGRPVLALFPGSREQELERHGRPFADIARELQRRVPGLQIVVSRVSFLPSTAYRSLPFRTTTDAHSLRALATAGLVKSGTGTLEAALAGMPFVVAYVTHPLTYLLARRLVRVPFIALANLVAGRGVVQEFLQHDVTTGAVTDALEPLLDESSTARHRAIADLAEVRSALGTPGAASRVVDMMSEILSETAAGRCRVSARRP
ncbi:MAG: lipid-A-disaccharide synthase [Gemmatimonadota bacterium]|nr:lipid-A-disaccharide synthase [Gemmatimonadota bacterium]MDE2863907.1 lipid-A-disaccharide synthase [Gemmatimonadota bacterium]